MPGEKKANQEESCRLLSRRWLTPHHLLPGKVMCDSHINLQTILHLGKVTHVLRGSARLFCAICKTNYLHNHHTSLGQGRTPRWEYALGNCAVCLPHTLNSNSSSNTLSSRLDDNYIKFSADEETFFARLYM